MSTAFPHRGPERDEPFWRKIALRLFLCATTPLLFSHTAYGQEAKDVSPPRQAMIIARALAYDANLKTRAGDTVNIAVLQKKGHLASEHMAEGMSKAFAALESTKILGLPIKVSSIVYAGAEALKRSIRSAGIDTIYVCDGLEQELGSIIESTRQLKVLTLAGKQEFVAGGLSLGVFEIDSKCTIDLNLQASRQEGSAFSAELLRLAHVIK